MTNHGGIEEPLALTGIGTSANGQVKPVIDFGL